MTKVILNQLITLKNKNEQNAYPAPLLRADHTRFKK